MDDIPAMVRMGEKFHMASTWAANIPFKADDFADTIKALIGQETGIAVVGEDGFALAVMASPIFNADVLIAQDLVVWGDGSLLAALEDSARKKGAKAFIMAAQQQLRPRAMDRWLRMQGYKALETYFVKEL